MDEACAQVDDLECKIEQLEEEKAALGVRLPDTNNPTATTRSDSKAVASPEVPDSVVKQFSRDDNFRLKAESSDPNERAAAAANPECPVEILLKLATDTDVDVLIALGSNSSDPEDAFSKIASTADKGALHEICFRSTSSEDEAFSHELLARMSLSDESVERLLAAMNKNCPQPVLEVLRRDKSPAVRRAAVMNGTVLPFELATLVNDFDPPIRRFVARHPTASAIQLEMLANDPVPSIRHAVALHPRIAQSTLACLAADADASVRAAVAGHPNTSDTSLLRLSEDSAAKVRVTVANRNPVSPEVLMTIAHSRFFEYRRMVALNPSCPLDLLEKLSADPEPEVSKAAKNRLNCTSALPADTGQPYATTSPSPKARRQTQKLTPEVQAAVDAIKARPENSKRFQQQTPPVNPEAKIKLEHEQPLDELLKAAGITLPDPVEWNKKYPDPKP